MLLGVASGLKILVWFEGVESCGYACSLQLEDGSFICKCWKSCGFAQGVHVVGIIWRCRMFLGLAKVWKFQLDM